MKKYLIHTDGSCLGNPGAGGWAFHVRLGVDEHEFSGYDPETTNNRMELHALTEALAWLLRDAKRGDEALVRSDSRYVLDGLTQYMPGWKRRGWKKADGKPVLNQAMWLRLDELRERVIAAGIACRMEWVRGHAGDPGNERVDVLARTCAENGAAAARAV